MKILALSIPGYGKIDTPKNIPNGTNAGGNIISAFLNLLVVFGIVAALIFLLYGGVLWVTSQGDKQKLDKAKSTITYAIIGLIIIIFSFVIVRIIGTLINSQQLSNLGM